MIGMCFERSVPRMSSASSKPSIVGMWMSRNASAKSCTNNSSSAAEPELALKISRSSPLQQRFEREEVLLDVIDQQALDLIRHPTAPCARRNCARAGRFNSTLPGAACKRGRGHGDHFRGFERLHGRDAAGVRHGRKPRGAVGIGARQHDSQQPLTIGLRGRLEQHVDRRPRKVHPIDLRQRESAVRSRPAGDSQASRSRSCPASIGSLSSANFMRRAVRTLEDFRQQARTCRRAGESTMATAAAKLCRQRAQDLAQRLDGARRAADHDEFDAAHASPLFLR